MMAARSATPARCWFSTMHDTKIRLSDEIERHTLTVLVDNEAGVIAAIEQEARDQLIKNMCATALLIGAAALAREESRGGHFRIDFPHTDEGQARRSRLTLREERRIASGL